MSAATADARQTGTESPCRRALRLARALPCTVTGPVLLEAFLRLAAICFGDVTVAARSVRAMVPPAGPGREHEPCRSVVGRLHQSLVAFLAPAFQFPDDSLPPDLVLEGEDFEVGESIDRHLHSDPVDVGFDKAVLFH